jgi:hypothetical protein
MRHYAPPSPCRERGEDDSPRGPNVHVPGSVPRAERLVECELPPVPVLGLYLDVTVLAESHSRVEAPLGLLACVRANDGSYADEPPMGWMLERSFRELNHFFDVFPLLLLLLLLLRLPRVKFPVGGCGGGTNAVHNARKWNVAV